MTIKIRAHTLWHGRKQQFAAHCRPGKVFGFCRAPCRFLVSRERLAATAFAANPGYGRMHRHFMHIHGHTALESV